MESKGVRLLTQGAKRVHPTENRIELGDGTSTDYDYLVVATGPELAFDEIPGLGPQGHTQSTATSITPRTRRKRLKSWPPIPARW